jgi:hypothetical protein
MKISYLEIDVFFFLLKSQNQQKFLFLGIDVKVFLLKGQDQ